MERSLNETHAEGGLGSSPVHAPAVNPHHLPSWIFPGLPLPSAGVSLKDPAPTEPPERTAARTSDERGRCLWPAAHHLVRSDIPCVSALSFGSITGCLKVVMPPRPLTQYLAQGWHVPPETFHWAGLSDANSEDKDNGAQSLDRLKAQQLDNMHCSLQVLETWRELKAPSPPYQPLSAPGATR